MPRRRRDAIRTQVHFLDVGPEEYADAVLCQFGDQTVLIDGAHPGNHESEEGHPSIPEQLRDLLGTEPPHEIDLLIVTHAHQDHIGCLPKLVADNIVRFRWALVSDPDFGWGRAADEDRDAEIADARVQALVAALRDECVPLSPTASDARINQFIADAVTLEQRYREMLRTLAQRHTRIVLTGRDDPADLERAFASIGLRVLGPSEEQVLHCADLINGGSRDAAARVSDLFMRDAELTPARIYRRLTAGDLDALDLSRPGPAVNLQSAVTVFEVAGKRFLFAGDMQFEDPQVTDDTIIREVGALRRRVTNVGRFALAKLSHHGSSNAFSEEILSELNGTALFGICAGEHSTRHPNPATLRVLQRHRDELRWARTDRNGRVTMSFDTDPPDVQLTQGRINDPRPNSDEAIPPPAQPIQLPPQPAPTPEKARPSRPAVVSRVTEPATEFVEIRARVPHVDTRVTLTIEIAPAGGGNGNNRVQAKPAPDAFRLGSDREFPPLLFVTQSETLIRNIGEEEASAVLATIRASGMALTDLPANTPDVDAATRQVRAELQANRSKGVVILGGHDVVPHQMVDCLPPALRSRLGEADDPDRFFVWSDDAYGDTDGDGMPELPVSRIPDGKSADLVRNALRASAPASRERAGIRNIARPFADPIFSAIRGTRELFTSEPTVFNQPKPVSLDADQLYFMLHGDYVDGTRFWGEDTADGREAINIDNLPSATSGVVFTGCCWGALTTDTPAGLVAPGRPFGLKTADSSIALAFLSRGARAFVGCTGAHYSPTEIPYNYFGGPMHRAFWQRYVAGSPPARALFEAKADYVTGMPHGRDTAAQRAIEFKILRQYTCLGLGW